MLTVIKHDRICYNHVNRSSTSESIETMVEFTRVNHHPFKPSQLLQWSTLDTLDFFCFNPSW